jgi:hypothetical protein
MEVVMWERFFDSHLDAAEFASTLIIRSALEKLHEVGDELFLL